MINNSFESVTDDQENFSKEQWQNKLELIKKKREQLLAQASDFYDQELYDLYVSTSLRFGADSDAQRLYINSGGNDYEAALQNYKQFVDFQHEQLEPIDKEIRAIVAEINIIRNKEARDKNRQIETEAEEKFQTDKKELVDALYEALDAIHSQIPEEAHEIRMTTEAALKTYLPELVYRAERIERSIKKAEDVRIPYDIANIKRELEGYDDILKK